MNNPNFRQQFTNYRVNLNGRYRRSPKLLHACDIRLYSALPLGPHPTLPIVSVRGDRTH